MNTPLTLGDLKRNLELADQVRLVDGSSLNDNSVMFNETFDGPVMIGDFEIWRRFRDTKNSPLTPYQTCAIRQP